MNKSLFILLFLVLSSLSFVYASEEDDIDSCVDAKWFDHAKQERNEKEHKRKGIVLAQFVLPEDEGKHPELDHTPGYNLTTHCSNSACKFYKQYVVAHQGFKTFTLIENGKIQIAAKCPICKHNSKAEQSAFNNCYYQITQWRGNNGGKFIGPWLKVEDEILKYVADDDFLYPIRKMIIITKPLTDPEPQDDDL